eukprot:TRINITY_DN34865_c0_g1_i1.p1 TRINITY_DN34865_c0_g1~~TRINITY_DN34865_c0_g1_i1.p1  ORF type:complete len:335 (-),score=37.00 TRINITY_DN34865_c0_g1_i1:11-1015(-)
MLFGCFVSRFAWTACCIILLLVDSESSDHWSHNALNNDDENLALLQRPGSGHGTNDVGVDDSRLFARSLQEREREKSSSAIRVEMIKDPLVHKSSSIVVFMTSYDSEQHMDFLKCWPSKVMSGKSMLSTADLILYKTGQIRSELKTVLAKFPNRVVKLIHAGTNPGYQSGAIKAVADAFENGWIDDYEWMIRLNPDVIVWSEAPLLAAMNSPSTWGIFANCKTAKMQRRHPGIVLTHTDFFAVRPAKLARSSFSNYTNETNAEVQATEVFRFLIEDDHVFWMVKENRDGDCRLRGNGIWHENSMCNEVFDRLPWHAAESTTDIEFHSLLYRWGS